MTTKIIHCKDCGTYLGEIRDAKLKKGMTFVCGDCTRERHIADMARDHQKEKLDRNVADFMSGLMKKKKGEL